MEKHLLLRMSMEIYPLVLIFASASIHLLWNTLMKSSHDKLVFMARVFLSASLFFFPVYSRQTKAVSIDSGVCDEDRTGIIHFAPGSINADALLLHFFYP